MKMKAWRQYYEISPFTLAVLADERTDGKVISLVVEEEERFYVDQSPRRLLDQACKFYGSSLRGRQDGTKDVCGITHKAPIAVDPVSGMYFFPTNSPQNKYCSWIAHSHIDHAHKTPENNTQITFKSGEVVIIDVSNGSIWNQIQRTAQFRYQLAERLQYIPKQASFDQIAEPFA
ncbi:competence protein ComK [Pontibacillus sp. HMF3514]|uniref:competence protein ComK n=1 Tax=Pontibacillus sp. HMF3514 TaxID=2692425 RepID=UPI001F40A100|nr:competence protein ComK [Pontibacillus sp. HMF3514]